MIFSSLTFVVFFIGLLGVVALARGTRMRQLALLIASYVFYGAWDVRFCLLILASSLWSWGFGLALSNTTQRSRRRLFLTLSLLADLGMLAYFKYANFFLDSFYSLLGMEPNRVLDITLPVGISFFTFQTMSYTIDLYRKRIPVCRDVFKFTLFVAFFPQLVAGPIVRASEFLPQLEKPVSLRYPDMVRGLQVFLLGLLQKVLVADNLSFFVDPVFADPTLYNTMTLWSALAAYSLQIFCDFSGYSLMAIGVGRVMGFNLPENFRTPYLSKSITEFWRRWHISLSTWLRDYLYISLGGNRKGRLRTDVNLMITMILGGLWHGAGWNFVLWGTFHGLGLMVHKHWKRIGFATSWTPVNQSLYGVFAWSGTLLFTCLLWVPFRCADFPTTLQFLNGLFSAQEGIAWLHQPSLLLIAAMVFWHALREMQSSMLNWIPTERLNAFRPLFVLGMLTLALLLFAPLKATPFIYFQF